jgi:hypothetical protein
LNIVSLFVNLSSYSINLHLNIKIVIVKKKYILYPPLYIDDCTYFSFICYSFISGVAYILSSLFLTKSRPQIYILFLFLFIFFDFIFNFLVFGLRIDIILLINYPKNERHCRKPFAPKISESYLSYLQISE